MQSPAIKGTNTLSEVIAAAVNSIKVSATGVYEGGGLFSGNFDKIIFAENPANSFATVLQIGNKEYKKCTLTEAGKIQIQSTDTFGLVNGQSYSITEKAPYFYDCRPKELNIPETAQPAVWLPRPQKENIFDSNAESYGIELNLILVVSDLCKPQDWKAASEKSYGFTENKFNLYVEKPLSLTVRKLLGALDNFTHQDGDGIKSQIILGEGITQTYVRRFGEAGGLVELGFDESLSGFILEIPMKIYNTLCML